MTPIFLYDALESRHTATPALDHQHWQVSDPALTRGVVTLWCLRPTGRIAHYHHPCRPDLLGFCLAWLASTFSGLDTVHILSLPAAKQRLDSPRACCCASQQRVTG